MATLPERAECIECGNLTRFTRDDGMATCRDCMDIINAAREARQVTYPVRMPAPCGYGNCFDSASSEDGYCTYHAQTIIG